MMNVVEMQNVEKSFGERILIEKSSLTINAGEFVAIVGASGTGKSTLLNMFGLLDKQTNGDLILFGEKNISLTSRKAMLMLREKIGFIFQDYGLVQDETVEQNLLYALAYTKENKKQKMKEALAEVHLEETLHKKVNLLSGGEQQRIALARLLLKPCDLILADEPTGNLDCKNREIVFNILKHYNELGKTVIIVTHDQDLANHCDRIIEINNCKLHELTKHN